MEAAGPLLDDMSLFNELLVRLNSAGYLQEDVDWAENTQPPIDASEFAREAIFVICNSGMKHTIARQIYDKIIPALLAGESSSSVFGHAGKCGSIDRIWADQDRYFAEYMAAEDKIEYCRSIPWIGGITCYHLAKNFGAQVAKPDIHLVRLSERHATDAQTLCETLSERSGYKINTVDLILWRACAVGILDGHTSSLIEDTPKPVLPVVYQEELFVPTQAELFPA